MNTDPPDLSLINPDIGLEDSHNSFLREFQERGERVHPWVVAEPFANFSDYIEMLDAASLGVNLPPGYVAHSTFWLVNRDNEIVAVSNVRHELNEFLLNYGGHIGYGVRPSARRRGYATELLRQSLIKAKQLGIERLRIMCAKDNAASAKTILKNGGILADEVVMPEDKHVICRYWIDLWQ